MVKVERTFPAPASLAIEAQKQNGSYSQPDVVRQLKSDFHNKCYICELDDLQDPQIEHLLPHKNGKFPQRKYDWNNLFWACGHCNNVKNQQKYDAGIIDCCTADPEEKIGFTLINGEVQVWSRNADDKKAVLTAELIMEVFNLKNTGMRIEKSQMRFERLNQEMNKLYNALEELDENPNSKFALRKVKVLLKRTSGFAAFKREYVRENQKKYQELLGYLV